jgi:transcriptional regulator with XRE-family HTH domain
MAAVTPLKIAIVTSGLTMREVAARIGCHHDEISHMANGRRRPKLDRALALARLLEMPVEELFPLDDERLERAA